MTEQQDAPRRRSRTSRVHDALAEAAPEVDVAVLRRQTEAVMQQVVVPLAVERDTALAELFRRQRAEREAARHHIDTPGEDRR